MVRPRLQSRQFPAGLGDARADQGMVADDPQGEADQDRREGREPSPLRRLPDGGGGHSSNPVRRYLADDRRAPIAALGVHSVEHSRAVSLSQTTGDVRPDDEQFGRIPCLGRRIHFLRSSIQPRRFGLVKNAKGEDGCIRTGVHPGNHGLN